MRVRVLAAAASLAIALGFGAAAEAQSRRGRALEERLMAPCCWTQTLDAHDSPEASALRQEIDRRLVAGETAGAIEDDLVARYGARIRAVPSAGFLDPIGLIVLALLAASALALVARWRRRPAEPRSAPETTPVDDTSATALDARLRAELERMSDV